MFQETLRNFAINVNALNDRNTFSSGDPVTGHVSFDLTKETKITSILMHVKGEVNIQLKGNTRGMGTKRRKIYNDKEEFFDLQHVLMQANSITDDSVTLRPGTYIYPFSCRLPVGSFPSPFNGRYGQIVYYIKVDIKRPWHMKKEFETELTYANRINMDQPDLQAPLSGSNKMTVCTLFCSSYPVSLSASAEKKAFIPGETVKITCKVMNGSPRTITPNVKLRQIQEYRIPNYSYSKRQVCETLASVTGQPISAYSSDEHTEIMLTIPSSAVVSISNCMHLMVQYEIKVSLSGWGVPGLTVVFPVILCEPPVQLISTCIHEYI